MKRRMFIKSLSLVTIGLLTGCSTNFNTYDNEGKNNLDKYYKELSFIDMIKISYKKGLKDIELAGFGFKDENKFTQETVYTLPWYIGPDMTISRDAYLLNIYNRDNLLFTGHGLNSKSLFMVREFLPENYNERLNALGFKDFNSLYDFIFSKVANYSREEVFVFINKLINSNVVNQDIYNQANFNRRLDLLINKVYATYIKHEMSLTTNELDNRNLKTGQFPLENWLVNGITPIYFKKDDFYIYNLVNMLCIDIINSDKGIHIYEY